MRSSTLILLILLLLPSCISEQGNSLQLNNRFISPERRITKSYINYIEAINSSGIPISSCQPDYDQNSKSIISRKLQTDKDLQYFPATLWQLYSFDGNSKWKCIAESLNEIIQMPDIAFQSGNGELIQNTLLTQYRITGDRKYYKILIESLNQQVSDSKPVNILSFSSDDGAEIPIDKLLENELLFFASRETGDPIYRKLAIAQSDQIYRLHFRNNLSNNVFYGLASKDRLPGIMDLENLESYDLYNLSLSFYGFTILFNELGDDRYGELAFNLARLFTSIFEGDNMTIRENLDLTSRTLICLAISRLSKGSDASYEATSERIFKSLLGNLDLLPGADDYQYSFRMYYYLFECLKQGDDSYIGYKN